MHYTYYVGQLALLWIINLKAGKFYFGSWFQRFKSMVGWFCSFGILVVQYVMVEVWGRGLFTSWCLGSNKKKGKHRVLISPSRTCLQWPSFFPIPKGLTTFHRLANQIVMHGPLGEIQDPNYSTHPIILWCLGEAKGTTIQKYSQTDWLISCNTTHYFSHSI
jgi:hypothetical protein